MTMLADPFMIAADLLSTPRWTPRDYQVPPDQRGAWRYWLLMAGRGAGKSDAGAEYVTRHVSGPPCLTGSTPHRISIVAPTLGDAVESCWKEPAGIAAHDATARFVQNSTGGSMVKWANGSEAKLFGASTPDDVERFRAGGNRCLVWAEELAAWRFLDDVWDQIMFGLRIGPHPRAIITTTPKPRKALKALIADPLTVMARKRDGATPTTNDNPHLNAEFRALIMAKYAGTRLGRQEIGGEIIDDVEGALWTREMIRLRPAPTILRGGVAERDMRRVVVAIDPAVTSGADSDETGIIVDGIGTDGHGYTLADLSGRFTPTDWARRAIAAYHEYRADHIVAEVNNGGELVRTVIQTIDGNVPVRMVHASRGKITRAEPVSTLYIPSEHRPLVWFHAEPFPELEDQMCNYTGATGDDSPDRMDAHVWGATDLALEGVWQGASDVAVA